MIIIAVVYNPYDVRTFYGPGTYKSHARLKPHLRYVLFIHVVAMHALVQYVLPFYFISVFASTAAFRNVHQRSARRALRTLYLFESEQQQQISDSSKVYQSKTMQCQQQSKEKVDWIIRPANVNDRDGCAALIQLSYGTLLSRDYSDECLAKCLPLITTPREQLLTCNTWFVVEHPSTPQIVGCGGWTVRSPLATTCLDKNEPNEEATPKNDNLVEKTSTSNGQDAPVPHLRHFATHPGYARMGIASSIWQRIHSEMLKQCLAQGIPFPTMEVFSTLTAEGFYASCGFEVISRSDMALGNDAVFPVILMRRCATKGQPGA